MIIKMQIRSSCIHITISYIFFTSYLKTLTSCKVLKVLTVRTGEPTSQCFKVTFTRISNIIQKRVNYHASDDSQTLQITGRVSIG